MESSRQIEDRAAAWLAQRDGGHWTEADETELSQWLNSSTAHRVAFLRLEAGWERSSRLKVFGVNATAGRVPLRGRWQLSAFFSPRRSSKVPASGFSRRSGVSADESDLALDHGKGASGTRRPYHLALSLAASFVLAIGVGAYFALAAPGERYTTPIGGVASIPLLDGSQITLNTASKIRVALTEVERHIELESGEAFFQVAKDASRPFIVEAGNRRIIAVGTQFSVRRTADLVDVVVTEGTVRVEPSTFSSLQPAVLTAGAIAHAGADEIRVQTQPLPKVEEALSWRTGYLTFDEVTLADAVAEFNRYNTQKIYIEDPELAGLRISGKFRATNSTDFIQLLRSGFAIQTRQTDDSTYLVVN